MNSQSFHASDETQIRALYEQLLDAWNKRNATDFAALFEEDGDQIGFDGSQVNGRSGIESHLSTIFADHMTAAYVGKIR